jgi:hypothetical protein
VFASRAYGPVSGAINRAVRMPPVTKASFVQPLSANAEEASAQRQRLLAAWRSKASYGLHREQSSVEGTPIGIWLVAQGGSLTLVTDYSRDPYSTREVHVQNPVSLELGPLSAEERHPLRSWFPSATEVYLRCRLASNQVAFF